MALLSKDPAARLDYTFEWGDGYLEDGETLASSDWQISPDETLLIEGETNDATTATVTLSGGVAGNVYLVTNQVTTTQARTDERSFTLRIHDR